MKAFSSALIILGKDKVPNIRMNVVKCIETLKPFAKEKDKVLLSA